MIRGFQGLPKYAGLCLLFLLFGFKAHAQIPNQPIEKDSIKTALLPAAGYGSDIGLLGGGLFSRIDYSGGIQPFNNYIKASLTASTKGMFTLDFEYDQIRSLNSDVRSKITFFVYRYTTDYYFGIGNQTQFSLQAYDDRFYFFESTAFGLKYEGRLPLYTNRDSRFDLLFGLGTRYEIPYVKQDSSQFNVDRPNGITGGWINSLKTGFIWENRNSEFDPVAGNRAEVRLNAAPAFLLSDFEMLSLEADYRHYFRLLDWVTVANRLRARYTRGDVPYWELSKLGNHQTLRGYPLNRFMGNSSIAYTLELRKWVVRFPEYAIKIGLHLFTDVGRVFTEDDNSGDLLEGYKQTFGVGGTLSLFSPDFILRGEAGFSEDLTRIYVGIGYTF